MTYTLYDATVPLFVDSLNTLLAILDKAEEHAAEKNIDISLLLQAKLAEDMHPLIFQYHVATDTAMKTVTRIINVEPEPYTNDLKNVSDLRGRVNHTIDLIKAASKDAFEGRTNALIPLAFPHLEEDLQMKAVDYIRAYSIPNFFFHVQTAYCILRSQGVQLGKADFLGASIGPFLEQHQKQHQK
ncbi:uncharacterized protein ColSpa_06347 [Colletotrichum spaethianum]|uniref:Helix-turn-helix-domain containing protein type n=1 Tax=Colletotrichum spaethianum TaxID=700344 RepID=A0AA37LCK9_9PEZI|nr:uncharacterized protein ColSpa_06347 [Colletotrichum spaethianum]GKT46166.1 hypothetical protein ColSpa_06347 [Colletotrichum spaethianum]